MVGKKNIPNSILEEIMELTFKEIKNSDNVDKTIIAKLVKLAQSKQITDSSLLFDTLISDFEVEDEDS